MKKLCSVLLAMFLFTGILGVGAAAAEPDSVTVLVDIAKQGEQVFAKSEIAVTDLDNDGKISIGDALWAAHEAGYTGGAAAGYAQADSGYGLGIVKLWGDNSGNFGYFINNQMPMNLEVELKTGDHISAYVYKQSDYSDVYCYFNDLTAEKEAGKTVDLELKGFINWSTTATPIANATVTINGEETAFKTDAEGKVTLTLPEQSGNYIISAKGNSLVLVPPVCHIKVNAKVVQNSSSVNTNSVTSSNENVVSNEKTNVTTSPKTGDITWLLCAVLVLVGGAAVLVAVRAKAYEK